MPRRLFNQIRVLIRKLISSFNSSFAERVVAPRYKFSVPVVVSFEPNKVVGKPDAPKQSLSISGETKDLSKTGIAFFVSAIRLKEYYLVGEDRVLDTVLDLPNGKVQMQIIGKRYEQISSIESSTSQFLIGAHIIKMSPENRDAYEEFLRLGKTKGKVLQLKPDQS